MALVNTQIKPLFQNVIRRSDVHSINALTFMIMIRLFRNFLNRKFTEHFTNEHNVQTSHSGKCVAWDMEASSEHIVTCDKDTSTSCNVHDVTYVVTIIVQHFSKLLQLNMKQIYMYV